MRFDDSSYNFKEVPEATAEKEIMQGKQQEMEAESKILDQEDKTAEQPTSQPAEQPAAKGRLGFFGTIGVSFLSITNRTIGGEEIKFDGIKLMDGKDMDALLIEEMIAAGNELDVKYFKGNAGSPELRYLLSGGLFFVIKGRLFALKKWIDGKRSDKKE